MFIFILLLSASEYCDMIITVVFQSILLLLRFIPSFSDILLFVSSYPCYSKRNREKKSNLLQSIQHYNLKLCQICFQLLLPVLVSKLEKKKKNSNSHFISPTSACHYFFLFSGAFDSFFCLFYLFFSSSSILIALILSSVVEYCFITPPKSLSEMIKSYELENNDNSIVKHWSSHFLSVSWPNNTRYYASFSVAILY